MSADPKAVGRMKLEVISPEGLVVDAQVDEVVVSTLRGEMGVLPGHEPLLALLQPAPLSYRKPGQGFQHLAVSDGFVEVGPDHTLVLARTAELAADLDAERAQAALRDRTAELQSLPPGDPAREPLELALARASARIRAIELARKG